MRDGEVAAVLGTFGENCLKAQSNSLSQVVGPAVCTELVSTAQTHSLLVCLVLVELLIADDAVVLVGAFLRCFQNLTMFAHEARVELQSNGQSQLVLILKPLIIEFVAIPFEVSEHLDSLILIESHHVHGLLSLLLLSLQYTVNGTHDKAILYLYMMPPNSTFLFMTWSSLI